MNNNEFYDRRDARAVPEHPTPPPQPNDVVSALAVHHDPSMPAVVAEPEAKTQRRIGWVRPSELPTLVGAKWTNRGIDLQSELIRRSRRAPVTAAKAGHRISRRATAQPEPSTPTAASTGELGL